MRVIHTTPVLILALVLSAPPALADDIEDGRVALLSGLDRCARALAGEGIAAFADLTPGDRKDRDGRVERGTWTMPDGGWVVDYRDRARRPMPTCMVRRAGKGAPQEIDRVLIIMLDAVDELFLGGVRFTLFLEEKTFTGGRLRVLHTCDLRAQSVTLMPWFAQNAGRVQFQMGRNILKGGDDAC